MSTTGWGGWAVAPTICENRTSNTRRTTLRGGLVAIPGGLANANIAGCEKVDIF